MLMKKQYAPYPVGFEKSRYSGFDTIEQANALFSGYCRLCDKNGNCGIITGIGAAIGNNYPIWFDELVKLTRTERGHSDRGSSPDVIIHCLNFNNVQTELELV
jgi:hypothetical protein